MEPWMIALGTTLFLAWNGFLVAVIKWLIDRQIGQIDQQIAVLDSQIKGLIDEQKLFKSELASLMAQLPVQYVRQENCRNCREEWLRVVTMIDQRLNSLGDRFDTKIDELRRAIYGRVDGH